MKFVELDKDKIEIVPEEIPIKVILETMARVSYGLAKPVGGGFLQPFNIRAKDVDFSEFMNNPMYLMQGIVLEMDYVNGRRCKTRVRFKRDGRYIFSASNYRNARGCRSECIYYI